MPTTITISEFQVPDCNFTGTTAKLRRYYNQDWTDVDGVFHAEGHQNSSTDFFDEISCTLSSNTITVPSFSATPTDNPQTGSNVLETWQLWDQAGSPRNVIFEGFIPSANPTITFGALLLLNRGQTLFENDRQSRLDQWIQNYIDTVVGSLRFATSVIAGWVRLSTAAADVADPIAVGKNDYATTSNAGIGKSTVTRSPTSDVTFAETTDARLTADQAANVASIRTLGTGALQATAGNDARLSDTRVPTDNSVTSAKIVDGTIVDADVATANKDGAAGTPSMRTLGTGATQATAGNDSRLSDARTPTGAAGGELAGTYPNPTIVTGTGADDVVRLDGTAKLPAVDGSALTALNATNLGSGSVPAARMPALTGDVTSSAGSVSTTLANTAVVAGSYTRADITVDAKGRITEAANSAPAVSSFNGRNGVITLTQTDVREALVQGASVEDATDASSVILRLNELLAIFRTQTLIASPFDANDYPGLLRWYKPESILVGDGVGVDSWADSSPAADPAVQGTAGNRPIYHATGGPDNGRHVTFDGVNDFLSFTQITTLRTLYVVVKHRTGDQPANSPVLFGDPTTFPYQGQTGTRLFTQSGTPSAVANGQFFVDGTLKDYYVELKDTDYQIYSIVSAADGTVSYFGNDRNVNFWDGDFGEVIMYSAVHTKAQRQAIVSYLGNKYAITTVLQSQPGASTKILYAGNSILAEGSIQTFILRAMNPATISGGTSTWAAGGRTTQTMASLASINEDVGFDAAKDNNILIGWEITNDLANTDLSATTTAAAAAAAYTEIANYYIARKAAHPTVKVIVVTCLPRNSNMSGTDMTPADFETMRLLVNASLVANWQTYGDALADVGGDASVGAWFTDRVGQTIIGAGGTGYSDSFAVTFTGGGGSGATGTATAVGGVVQSVVMTDYGDSYTSAPTPDFSAGGGSGATGTAQLGAVDMTLIDDGTHPNTAGKNIIANIMISAIGRLGLGA